MKSPRMKRLGEEGRREGEKEEVRVSEEEGRMGGR